MKRASGALSFFYNWGRHKINDGYHPGGYAAGIPLQLQRPHAGRVVVSKRNALRRQPPDRGFRLSALRRRIMEPHGVLPANVIPGVDKQMDEFAGYVDFRQDLGELALSGCGHPRRPPFARRHGMDSARAAFRSTLPRQTEVKAMVSKGFRNPTIREMYMFPPQNPDLNGGKPDELRVVFLAAGVGRRFVLRHKSLLH